MPRTLATLALLLVAATALAAPPGTSLVGHVADESGAPVPGAQVTAAGEGNASGPAAATDDRGAFRLVLGPGAHTLIVMATGFAPFSHPIDPHLAGEPDFRIVLQVAGLHESVIVRAPAGRDEPSTIRSATRTPTPLIDVPQSIAVVNQTLIRSQLMTSVSDAVRYVPGVTAHQGENNRDQLIMRGNNSSADFFIDGVRDDAQYYRDLYNLSRVEVIKGPNALAFGRGGAGGVVNRVAKEAGFSPLYEVTLQGGMHGHKRVTTDVGQAVAGSVAVRLNAMLEDSDSFRSGVGLERYGVTPSMTFAPSVRTKLTIGYEHLHDARVADRGLPSFQGLPVAVDRATYYGNPADSRVAATVNVGHVTVEHLTGGLSVRNHTSLAGYDRAYQNYVPGAVSADRAQVILTAYNNAATRTNLFNQTDLVYVASTGTVRQTLLGGFEAGRQMTDNFRNTGFFNNSATSISVPFAATRISTPVTFRQSATDADNHVEANLAAVYVQDQVELSRHLQVVGGARFDRFDLRFHNNRGGAEFRRTDHLVSPRAGLVVKPIADLSLYGSYSVSYLPSSGDQFSSLTAVTEQLQPERFDNYEAGVKWNARPGLSVTTAVYRLDRTNTRAIDPNDPTRTVQTGSQRTNGYELGASGRLTPAWEVAGGYAYQDAFVTHATVAAAAGAQAGQVPRHTLSLWNRYHCHPRWSVGLGVVHRSDMFAAVDNTVTLPGYVRADGAVYVTLGRQVRLQANVENLFDKSYFVNADSNTNISPGSPRAIRIGLTTTF